MPHPVLVFHRVQAQVFDLTGLRTGSVRDQLLRSTLLAQALAEERLIGPSLPLLVLGAGAAGMNAALTAAECGVDVDVIERESEPFGTFRQAVWRTIDPVEYDWPHEHHDAGVFPTVGSIPLTQHAGTACDLADLWTVEWLWWLKHCAGRAGRGRVNLIPDTDATPFAASVKKPDTDGTLIQVKGPWPDGLERRAYGAVVSCVGSVSERTGETRTPYRWHGYRGPAFWLDRDTLETPRDQPIPLTTVVISGGGDGAMQDLQRAATGLFGKALLQALQHAAATHLGQDLAPDRLLRELLAAEDIGRRAYAWRSAADGPPPRATVAWHRAFDDAVDRLFKGLARSAPRGLRALADAVLRPAFAKGTLRVFWVVRNETPGFAYALNRFLCLVIERLDRATGSCALNQMTSHEIVEISPATKGHRCGLPETCRGVAHDLIAEHLGTGRQTSIIGADLIIVRHGAMAHSLVGGSAPIREQMTPFDLPW